MNNPLASFSGFVAAPYTPFHPDGSLNLNVIEQQVERLIADGIKGAFVCGTTGEGVSLTLAERKAVAERWRKVAGERLTIIIHVGALCLSDARELASHAEQIGAAGIATIAPCFFKPSDVDSLVDWCAHVARAASSTPFLYYHIPTWTGIWTPVAEVMPRAIDRIPTFAGIKFTHSDLDDYAAAVKLAAGNYVLFFGADEILLSAVKVGCVAAVGSTYNYAGPIYHRVIKAFQEGRLTDAEAAQKISADFIALVSKYGGLPANKTILRLCGIDCGPVRLPLRTLTDDEANALRFDLESLGFFDALQV